MDHYGDLEPWSWQQQHHPQHHQPQQQPQQQQPLSQPANATSYQTIYDHSVYSSFPAESVQVPPSAVAPTPHATAPAVTDQHPSSPPPQQQSTAGATVKAHPAFKPTWSGYLDTTKDAVTIVEACLQGRLSHISRRPHDKERAEMLVSGTVLVYEENASGIKRWTDAVHWSPSRVMNNYLIYRQLVRAIKQDEKKTALNPSCGGKRKRKESTSPSVASSVASAVGAAPSVEDEYPDSTIVEGALAGDIAAAMDSHSQSGKVYANFAQNLSPEQQRRFCGSLVDSYEFKEGGLMKKTISVGHKGATHHVISYYSLEDVVSGKLKRPFQDPKLHGITPRPELLKGWKVSLEDEESKDLPLVPAGTYHPHYTGLAGTFPQSMTAHPLSHSHSHTPTQSHPPLPPQMTGSATEYWQTSQPQFPQHHTAQQYVQSAGNQYGYTTQHPSSQYSPHAYAAASDHTAPQYTQDHTVAPLYNQPNSSVTAFPAEHYVSQHHPSTPQHQYMPHTQYFDLAIHGIAGQSQHHEARRASAPVTLGTQNDASHYQTSSSTYYRTDPNQPYSAGPNNYGY